MKTYVITYEEKQASGSTVIRSMEYALRDDETAYDAMVKFESIHDMSKIVSFRLEAK